MHDYKDSRKLHLENVFVFLTLLSTLPYLFPFLGLGSCDLSYRQFYTNTTIGNLIVNHSPWLVDIITIIMGMSFSISYICGPPPFLSMNKHWSKTMIQMNQFKISSSYETCCTTKSRIKIVCGSLNIWFCSYLVADFFCFVFFFFFFFFM